ncbi:uncharacterized protein LOC111074927 isoform X3 [Drosophila obscura]|uniref:uncharacterized protein LOC111074927 isoform X3 n=1 Tax=Drosophila obscura TaxID=7282 RepID=UPI001BB1A810|nr:uncharacterized protein LOC111074927 isoform X3 [Drosophila obscura]
MGAEYSSVSVVILVIIMIVVDFQLQFLVNAYNKIKRTGREESAEPSESRAGRTAAARAPRAPRGPRGTDRQGNALNGSEERPHNRFGDIFFIEPSSEESARIRSQLEKDDKELPSYDEVMRMCNLTTPTAAAAAPHSPSADPSPIGIAALPAPPYSESDPHADAAAAPTVITMEPGPSTSRAAQSPTTITTTLGRSAPLTLPNTASNTEV